MTEAATKRRIMLDVGRGDVRLFNNPRGIGWMGKVLRQTADTVTLLHPRRVDFGLHAGASDLIGFRSVTITPDMVGQTVAVFAAVEVKAPGGKHPVSDEQRTFIEAVTRAGGLAGVARSPEQARLILGLAP